MIAESGSHPQIEFPEIKGAIGHDRSLVVTSFSQRTSLPRKDNDIYEVPPEDDVGAQLESDPRFIEAFRSNMDELHNITADAVVNVLEVVQIHVNEQEVTDVAAEMFEGRTKFTLGEVAAIGKELASRGYLGPAKDQGSTRQLVVQSRASRNWSRLLNYLTLSEASIVSGRKLLAFCVLTLFLVTAAVAIICITTEVQLLRDQTALVVKSTVTTLTGTIEAVHNFLVDEAHLMNYEKAQIVSLSLSSFSRQTSRAALVTTDMLAAVSQAHISIFQSFYLEQLQREIAVMEKAASTAVTRKQGSFTEDDLIKDYNDLTSVSNIYISVFVHCPTRPSSISRSIIRDSVLNYTFNMTNEARQSGVAVFSDGELSARGSFSNGLCPDCTKLVLARLLSNTSCQIGVVLNLTAMQVEVTGVGARAINQANSGITDIGGEAELVFSKVTNMSSQILSDMRSCGGVTCSSNESQGQPGYAASRASRGEAPAKGNGAYVDYTGQAVLASYVLSNTLQWAVAAQISNSSISKGFDRYLTVFFDNDTKSNDTDIDIAFDSGRRGVRSNPTFITQYDGVREFKNSSGDVFEWINSNDLKLHTSVYEPQKELPYWITITVTDFYLMSKFEALVRSILEFYNNNDKDASEEYIGVSYDHEPPMQLSEVHCSTCNLFDSREVKSAFTTPEGEIISIAGTDYQGHKVIGFATNIVNLAIVGTKTKSSVDRLATNTLSKVVTPAVILIILGALAMLMVVLMVNRQVRQLFEARGEMQARMAQLDGVLENMFPKTIKDTMLKKGQIVEVMSDISVSFMDIHSFTPIANVLTAQQLQTLLSYAFRCMDEIAGHYGVNKVKTIGDCYLAVCGLKGETVYENDAVQAMFLFCLDTLLLFSTLFTHTPEMEDILKIIEKVYREVHAKTPQLSLRAGMAVGNVLCGVLPGKVPSFDVWGPIINLAARLESNSNPGTIMISEPVYKIISRSPIYQSVTLDGPRSVFCKGFGKVNAYVLMATDLEFPKELRQLLQLEYRMGRYQFCKATVGDSRSFRSQTQSEAAGSVVGSFRETRDGEGMRTRSDVRSEVTFQIPPPL